MHNLDLECRIHSVARSQGKGVHQSPGSGRSASVDNELNVSPWSWAEDTTESHT